MKKDIAFVDLQAQAEVVGPEIEKAMKEVTTHGRYIMGPEVFELEEKLADFAGVPYAVACSSGTDALLMPLMAMGVGPGDAVFTSPFTFIATAEVIRLLGARPVFVDIDPETFNISPEKLEEAILQVKKENHLTLKCILPVDIFGLPAAYGRINTIARDHGMTVLEDAAQSFGAEIDGQKACSLCSVAATSFFPAKPLGCYGDGGAVFTKDENLYKTLKSIRVHGEGIDKYNNVRVGINGRMDTLQAAVLLKKLGIFPGELEKRNRAARVYQERLSGLAGLQKIPDGYSSAWAQFSLTTDNRDLLIKQLQKSGIPTAIYYPKPLHLQQAFADLGYAQGDFPMAEDLSGKIVSIPVHPYLTEQEIFFIADKTAEHLS